MSDDATTDAAPEAAPAAPTLEERFSAAADRHDQILQQERDLEVQLAAVKEQRHQAFGRVQTLRELLAEQGSTPASAQPPNRAARRSRAKSK